MFGLVSASDANNIYSLEVPGRSGQIGMSACPGVRMESLKRGVASRNVKRDIAAMQRWGATGVVSLVEEHELLDAGVGNLGDLLQEAGIWWRHLPIIDMNVPSQSWETVWASESNQIKASLAMGERIILHCLAGLGRTGLVAAKILVEGGMAPEVAIVQVRRVRPRAIQTQEQEDYVRNLMRKSGTDRWSKLRHTAPE